MGCGWGEGAMGAPNDPPEGAIARHEYTVPGRVIPLPDGIQADSDLVEDTFHGGLRRRDRFLPSVPQGILSLREVQPDNRMLSRWREVFY